MLAARPTPPERYIVYYPRAGLGNRLLAFASAYYLSVVTHRRLVLAPSHMRETFMCALFSDRMCSFEMSDAVRSEYTRTSKLTYHPEAWGSRCDAHNRISLRSIKCDDFSQFNEKFISISSCQYYLPLVLQNAHYSSHNLSIREIMSDVLPLQTPVCEHGLHIRKPISYTDLTKLVTCLRKYSVSHVFVGTMHKSSYRMVQKIMNTTLLSKTTPNNADNAADPTTAFSDLKFFRSCRRVFAANSVSTYTQIIATSYTQVVDWNTCQPIPTEPQSHIFSNDICAIQHTQC